MTRELKRWHQLGLRLDAQLAIAAKLRDAKDTECRGAHGAEFTASLAELARAGGRAQGLLEAAYIVRELVRTWHGMEAASALPDPLARMGSSS